MSTNRKYFNLNLREYGHPDVNPTRQSWEFQVSDGHDENRVSVKVVRWGDSIKGNWNYYLIVPISWLKEPEAWEPKFNPENESWNQYDDSQSKFHEIYFHGGVTYCKVATHGNFKSIEVGCDYAHYDDFPNMDDHYEAVFANAVETAKDFLSKKPYKPVEERK